jgi:glucose/arabinose dehydrogenase
VTEDTTTFTGNTLSIVTVLEIVDAAPAAGNHNGGNMTFGPDGSLYVSVGDGGGSAGNRSQEDTHLLGKILKLNVSGSLPVTYSNPTELFYSKGHRNSFDLAWNPANNVLYASENGPNANDEVNRVIQGGNYGWPIYQGYTNVTGFNSALYNWATIIAPTGITFYPSSGNFPFDYDNNMFVVDYLNGRIYRMVLGTQTLSLDTVISITTWDDHPSLGYADIEPGPDGLLYIGAFSHILKVAYTTDLENWMLFDKPVWKP